MPESTTKPKSSRIVPILTGVVSLVLGVGYLLLVEFLDSRGEMLPAPPLSSLLLIFQIWG